MYAVCSVTYFGEVEHTQVGVHVHGSVRLSSFSVKFCRVIEAPLIRVNVTKEDESVVLAATSALLRLKSKVRVAFTRGKFGEVGKRYEG